MNSKIKKHLADGYRRLFGRRNDQRVADVDTIQCKPIPAGCPPSSRLTPAGWITDD